MLRSRSHLYIPDTQDGPGRPTKHLEWIGQYIVDRKPDVVVHAGDHWDMAALNSHNERGSKTLEGQRYRADIDHGNASLELVRAPARRAKLSTEFHLTLGNHENRITRAVEADPRLEGSIGLDDLKAPGWHLHGYLEPVWIDGICYSHYFYQPLSGRPYSGTIDNRLKQIGHSFTMGHQQTLLYGVRYVAGRGQHGLVAGACLTPDHRVLMADLRYERLGNLEVGDTLVSFDEMPHGPRSRRFKTGTVQRIRFSDREVMRVNLGDGKQFLATPDHRWLTKCNGYVWKMTSELRRGTRIAKPLDEWGEATSYDAGWLAGLYDGEGCYYTRRKGNHAIGQLTLSQNDGAVLDRFKSLMQCELGVNAFTNTATGRDCKSLRIQGGLSNIAKVLGALRPTRLLGKFKPEHLGYLHTEDDRNPSVVSIEPAGVQQIVEIDIDAQTMIVEGFAHHNCYLHDEDYKGPQGNSHWRGVIVKHQVRDGDYDPMFVSLDYLCRRYENMTLERFKKLNRIK